MSECKYAPLFGRVIIKREIDTKIGSVLLPEHITKRHARCEGVIVAVGPTVDESIKPGMHVIFGRHSGTWLDGTYSLAKNAQGQSGIKDNDDGVYFLCQDEDLLATISGSIK